MVSIRLNVVQALPTSGARAAAVFSLDGTRYLALPQLAEDIASQPANMNGGSSDNTLPLFRWDNDRFVPWMELPMGGGEDWESFTIGGKTFAAVARIRSGSGPYDGNVDSYLLEWKGKHFETRQTFPTFAAKQWRAFEIKGRVFLALAQGAEVPALIPRNPTESCVFEWTGEFFRLFQKLPSRWGYNFHFFRVGDNDFLAYADHLSPSVIYRWDGESFVSFQEVAPSGGRAFKAFAIDGTDYLGFANWSGDTVVFRWTGVGFEPMQVLSGPGGREFAFTVWRGTPVLALIKFIGGTHEQPLPVMQSILFGFDGTRFVPLTEFSTRGGTDAIFFEEHGETYFVVSESLNAELRFRTDSHVYRLSQGE